MSTRENIRLIARTPLALGMFYRRDYISAYVSFNLLNKLRKNYKM